MTIAGIQKPPVVPAENSSPAGRRAQDFKTARLRELRLAKEAGFDYHVTKPLGKQQLKELLGRMPRF